MGVLSADIRVGVYFMPEEPPFYPNATIESPVILPPLLLLLFVNDNVPC